MPFIVTTIRYVPHLPPQDHEVLSRRAVATLDETHALLRRAVADAYSDTYNADEGWLDYVTSDDPQSPFVPASGGTVGPLPDGTTIQVEPICWDALREAAFAARAPDEGPIVRWPGDMGAPLVDAYNAAQGGEHAR